MPSLVSIFNQIQRRKCHRSLAIYDFQLLEWFKVDSNLTHSFLLNRFAGYTPPDGRQVAAFLPESRNNTKPNQNNPSILLLIHQGSHNLKNWAEKLKHLDEMSYTVIIASEYILHSSLFDWLPQNRFIFLSSGIIRNLPGNLIADPYLGRTLTKTIIDLLLNPDHDRFNFFRSFKMKYHGCKYHGCKNDSILLLQNRVGSISMEASDGQPMFARGFKSFELVPFDILL